MREPAKSFEDLIVWQKAHQFVLNIYGLTKIFPDSEKFGLTSQFRRAAISIPANISEGFKKRTDKEKARYVNIAQGSLEECHYYLILSRDLGYTEINTLNKDVTEIRKLLSGYRKSLLRIQN